MDRRPSPAGPLTAIAGASLVLASLWMPWYEMRIPEMLRDAVRGFGEGASSQSGTGASGFGKFLSGLAAAIPDSLEVNGWQGLQQADVALAIIASIVLLVGVAAGALLGPALKAEPELAGRLTALGGVACLAITGYHVVTRPAGNFPGSSDLIDLRQGVWVALLGSVLMLAGGLLTASSQGAGVGDRATAPSEPAARAAAQRLAGLGEAPLTSLAHEPAVETPGFTPTPSYTPQPGASTAPPGFG